MVPLSAAQCRPRPPVGVIQYSLHHVRIDLWEQQAAQRGGGGGHVIEYTCRSEG